MRSDQAGAGPLPGSDAGRGSGRITAQTQERKAREQLKKPGAAALGGVGRGARSSQKARQHLRTRVA